MAEAVHPTRGFGARIGDRTLAQNLALLVAMTFLLVGILGFVPGVTTDYDGMEFAGHESTAELLGVFQVSVLHNLVHLLFGLAGLVLARTHVGARSYLVGGGLLYLGVWLYGMAVDRNDDANFLPVNEADDWLHLGLGAGMVLLGILTWRPARDLADVTDR